MKCPLLRTIYINIPIKVEDLKDCIGKECVGWDEEENNCLIRIIRKKLDVLIEMHKKP